MMHINHDVLAEKLVQVADKLNRADVVNALHLLHLLAGFMRRIGYSADICMCLDGSGIIWAVRLDGENYLVPGKRVA